MLFTALLAAFLIEQLVPLTEDNVAHLAAKRWVLFARSKVFAAQTWHVWLWWSAAVLLPVVLSVLVYQLLWAVGFALAWLWLVGVLYFTMGFRQFSHHFSRIRDALQEGRDDEARAALAQWRQVDDAQVGRPDWVARVLSLALLAAQRHVLGVLVAFVALGVLGLGPAGAVLYRMTEYVARLWRVPAVVLEADTELSEDQLEVATQCSLVAGSAWHYLDWVPVRASAFGFAVAGNFEGVVGAWRDAHDNAEISNDSLLLAAGAGALSVTLQGSFHHASQDDGSDDEQTRRADLSVMSAAMLDDEFSSDALQQEGPAVPAKSRHVAALAGLVWRVVVLAMSVLAGLTFVAWVN